MCVVWMVMYWVWMRMWYEWYDNVWVNVYCENDDVYVSVWNDKNDDSDMDCWNCLRVIKEMKSINEWIIECVWME